jgi:hypothetical protein
MGGFGMIIAQSRRLGLPPCPVCFASPAPVRARLRWAKVLQMLFQICFFIGYFMV